MLKTKIRLFLWVSFSLLDIGSSYLFADSLTHYWPIQNGSMSDLVGHTDLQPGGTKYATDRFQNPCSALNLNQAYGRLPAGYYFDTPEFSVSTWILFDKATTGAYARIIDFSNGAPMDNILIMFNSGFLKLDLFVGSSVSLTTQSAVETPSGVWTFLTFTFDGQHAFIYMNGVLVSSAILSGSTPGKVMRVNNYVGKSCSNSDGYSATLVDDLKFFNVSLTPAQISLLMADTCETLIECTTTTTSTSTSTSTTTSLAPINQVTVCLAVVIEKISCKSPGLIILKSVTWGRQDKLVCCNSNVLRMFGAKACSYTCSLDVMYRYLAACNSKSSCNLNLLNLPTLCSGTYKYLVATWDCLLPGKTSFSLFLEIK